MTRRPLGAQVLGAVTRFSVFASSAERCSVRLFDASGRVVLETYALESLGGGYFARELEGVRHGARYHFLLDDRELPDPYARFLPDGVHAPAMVVEPRYRFVHERPRRSLSEQVIYELHVGTFTREGTYAAAGERLPSIAALGVTALELLPLSAFPGARGWGYDGVAHFAPFAAYGEPDELRAFIDRAHGLGLSVILDVVYNHFGPAGNYLAAYSDRYFTPEIQTPWGEAPRFAESPMRHFVLDNTAYWIRRPSTRSSARSSTGMNASGSRTRASSRFTGSCFRCVVTIRCCAKARGEPGSRRSRAARCSPFVASARARRELGFARELRGQAVRARSSAVGRPRDRHAFGDEACARGSRGSA